MQDNFIPLSVPNLRGNEIKYAIDAIKNQWVSTAGQQIKDFEQVVSSYVKAKAAAACQSGTAGLHLSLLALNIEKNCEVIVPTLTFIAAVNPVRYVGAHPVFMDCDDSLCMDMEKLERFLERECIKENGEIKNKLTGRKIKAILVVHIFGNMADMEMLMDIARRYSLFVIEDATEALGTRYTKGKFKGKHAGTMGDIGVYSFNGNKIITTGGGGLVVSDQQDLVDRVKFLSKQAKTDDLYFVHDEIGYNYRMTNVQAAIGLGQMEQLENFINIKTHNYNLYKKYAVNLLPFGSSVRSNYWFYTYLTENRDEIIKYMAKHGVQTRPLWRLIHTQKCYQHSQCYKIEKAQKYLEKIVNLPCSTDLDEKSIEKIAKLLISWPKFESI
ncbi:MAG: LegC family aminotransferase [Oscillospiraceae bacterium]|jgi:aminotransferase in exopolysaccharide biosynthesis|nr:LegC family aminotransferase [Oscillospiraceae bacterium]